MSAITAEDVQRVAQKYILPDQLAMVIVGDAEEVLPQVREYADQIEIFDTERNPLDISSFEANTDAAPENVSGNWELNVDFQGQEVQITMSLEQDADNISGTIETILGSGNIREGKVRGSKVQATASTEIQGQAVDFVITGSVDGDEMTGVLSTAVIPDSLAFAGKRKV